MIHKSYGRVSVLENVDFDLEEGEAHITTVRGAATQEVFDHDKTSA